MKWHEQIAKLLECKHSDTMAVIRHGKKGAKRRSNRRARRNIKTVIRKETL